MAKKPQRDNCLYRLYIAVGRLPTALQAILISVLYYLLYLITRYRRGVVHNNIRRAFPQKSEKALTVLEKKYYRHLSRLAVELLRAVHMPRSEFKARVRQSNPELIQACSSNYQRSVIILTIHQGNWEWMLHSSSATIPLPFVAVYKPLHSPAADKFMRRLRCRFGASALPVKNAARNILSKSSAPRCFVMLADQSPTPEEQTHWPVFFGQPTAFHAGPARLATLSGHPVVFAHCRRESAGYYCVHYELLAEAEQALDEQVLTQRYAAAAEAAIRHDPQSWLWSNRRWKRS